MQHYTSEISDRATACPKCGAPLPSAGAKARGFASQAWLVTKLLVGALMLFIVYQCTSRMAGVADAVGPTTVQSAAPPTTQVKPRCAAGDFTVSGIKTRREYDFIVFTGTVRNGSALPCGVQMKASTYDKAGSVVDTQDFWPASIRNIAPGASENFTYMLRYDKTASTYDMGPIDARQWPVR